MKATIAIAVLVLCMPLYIWAAAWIGYPIFLWLSFLKAHGLLP